MKMIPIPTMYKGVKFRSRLEARYAVFFDELDIRWEYEPEGFKLSDGTYYLPDFYLPDVYLRNVKEKGVYFEVKPSLEKAEEKEKIFNMFELPLVVACGQPPLDHWSIWLYEWWKDRWDNYMFFKYCKDCHRYEIEFAESNYCYCTKCKKSCAEPKKWIQAVSKMKSIDF